MSLFSGNIPISSNELEALRITLLKRYEDYFLQSPRASISGLLLPFIDKDPEAYLYCLLWEDIKLDEIKLFSTRFKYPKLVENIMGSYKSFVKETR